MSARMELDLRVGSIFTRVQTLELQQRVAALQESVISYGLLPPCPFQPPSTLLTIPPL